MARLTRQESKELTQKRLRDVAREEFARVGVSASSVDRIAEAAGYSRGAFYSNYESKNHLALELFREGCVQETHAWKKLVEKADPKQVLADIEQHFDGVLEWRKAWNLVGVELRLVAEYDPVFREHYETVNGEVMEMVQYNIRSLCKVAGCPEANAGYITLVLQAFTFGIPNKKALGPDGMLTGGQLLVKLLYDLLGQPKGMLPA